MVDLTAEHADRIHDRVDIGALLVAKLAGIARLQHLAEAADRGERRAQLIAHPRQEGGLGLVGRLQRLVAFAQRAFHFPARRNVEHDRSEEHTSELQSLMRISYAVFCLKKKKNK